MDPRKFLYFATIVVAYFAIQCYASRIQVETNVESQNDLLWLQSSRANPSQHIKLTFAIKQRNLDQLNEIFWAVSDPQSDRYGKHLSLEEVSKLVSPSQASLDVVTEWLKSFGIGLVDSTQSGDFLSVRVPIRVAEKLLHTEFYSFQHRKFNFTVIRATHSYTLPSEVARHVDFVGGVLRFPAVREQIVREANVHLEIDPRVLRDAYDVPSDVVSKSPNNSQAVAAFLDQHFSKLDLAEFFDIFCWKCKQEVTKVIGKNSWPPGVEASLDIEYIMGLGSQVPTWFWSDDNEHEGQEPFLEWIMNIGNTSDAPWIHSASYGDVEKSLSLEYTSRINVEFQKQGAMGRTIFFSSGDDGVGGDYSSECKRFEPNFPASSPYVTAVGGTAFETPIISEKKEIVNALSGGGFSDYFPQESYQKDAIKHYLTTKKDLPDPSYYNSTGRGYPDISALSEGFTVIVDFVPMPGVAGTSCSSPTVAGIFALLNDLRLQQGKPAFGFLNPWLYETAASHPEAFKPIIKGCNPGCNTDGFCAQAGWDPASGVGAPNYQEMARWV